MTFYNLICNSILENPSISPFKCYYQDSNLHEYSRFKSLIRNLAPIKNVESNDKTNADEEHTSNQHDDTDDDNDEEVDDDSNYTINVNDLFTLIKNKLYTQVCLIMYAFKYCLFFFPYIF